MNDDNPTKELTGSEKLERILSRFDKLQERFIGVENRLGSIEEDSARDALKLDTVLAAIQQLEEGLTEIKFELRRLNETTEEVARDSRP